MYTRLKNEGSSDILTGLGELIYLQIQEEALALI